MPYGPNDSMSMQEKGATRAVRIAGNSGVLGLDGTRRAATRGGFLLLALLSL